VERLPFPLNKELSILGSSERLCGVISRSTTNGEGEL